MDLQKASKIAAQKLKSAQALIITAGAGMGVDSGLPDFRGDKGFWKAYPLYERLGLSFYEAANPVHFSRDPAFGWGFYGHRANLYRNTHPHEGFYLLRQWIERFNLDYFVVTSNVDGHFQKAGFAEEKIYEIHGSISYLQCIRPCTGDIWSLTETIPVNLENMRAEHIPKCPQCGAVARPNILMFGDFSWNSSRSWRQERNFKSFLKLHSRNPLVVIETGAGTAVPTIRRLSEHLGSSFQATVFRINPREPYIAPPHFSLACGALEGLRLIDAFVQRESAID
ncbi:MAG TPA: Sir2 family NAD-dependent protein deacetylase [Bacillota bacterium]|jgi:NAD-dependent SIR2 family protein deacetylase|nr:Sir2 family NAD-dependent protein deacetylase [Peptococcaceae bacterium MAG4]NLW37307.1 NAD-dependent deacetylase [Peptococcaceae bacterium]HPZ43076.1 Sir2 family NAD-dependent protein deacetylase [Bacillota bacterium]HQD75814.1 Sir2 family NAD-dependent protein deacetylase [Bacillota bacterium]HUM58485.1 Sir2 family NAD-dependent protein deacetylase [Bacillota bacterium]